jgi:hypothetical protein
MGTETIPFVFSTPVWGAGHTGLFLNVGLPSLLAPGNLPGLASNPQTRYLIYTLPEYEKDIRTAPSFGRLARVLTVEIDLIRQEIVSPHRTMSDCHMDSFRRAEEAGAAAVFLPPDCVWSDGSMVRLEGLTQSGKSVVHMSGIRLDRDGFVPELAGQYAENRTVLTLKARELVATGLRHLHPIALRHFFDEYEGGLMPANLVWTVKNEGLLLRCFHLHPLMVKTQVPLAEFNSTIDDDLALRACPDTSRDYVVADSDELLAFEMSSLNHVVGTVCPKGSIEGIAAWAKYGTNARHRELIRHCIRVHSVPVTEPLWRAKETESGRVVDAVDMVSRLSRWQLLLTHPTVFGGLLYATLRGHVGNSGVPSWVVVLRWIWSTMRKLNRAFYQAAFTKNGSLLPTHPYWLVQRSMLAAIERNLRHGDRHIVILAADPALASKVAHSHPETIVQSFTADANPGEELVRRGTSSPVDLLLAVDLPMSGRDTTVVQRIGQRRILLRLSGDRRAAPWTYTEIVFFGGLGTRYCFSIWNSVCRDRKNRKPQSLLGQISLTLTGVLLAPPMYVATAIVGVAMNTIGLILDYFTQEEASSRREDESVSLESST